MTQDMVAGGSSSGTREAQGRTGSTELLLRLLVTTDIHAHLFPFDYYADMRDETVGLARTAALIRAAKAEAANCLVLDNGDFLQGTPLADNLAEGPWRDSGAPHPVTEAMSAAGIEVATLGNHDFNFGLDYLEQVLRGTRFPVVSANIARRLGPQPTLDEPFVPPFVMLERHFPDTAGQTRRIRIGVIGFAPPQLADWDRRQLGDSIVTRDIREAARAHLPRLRAAGADVVIALCHSGFGPPAPASGAENAALGLAEDGGIDVLIAGHEHLLFPSEDFAGRPGLDIDRGTAAGVPAIMAGASGSFLGVMDLRLTCSGGRWTIAAARSELRGIAPPARAPATACEPSVKTAAQPAHAQTCALLATPVGRARDPLSSHFALIAPCPCATLVARAQASALARQLAGTQWDGIPLLSAAASFRTGGRGGPKNYTALPRGTLTLRHAADLYPFPNRLCAMRLTGREIRAWLDRAAGVFEQLTPGEPDQRLVDPRWPSYNFDLIDGLSYSIDPGVPALYAPDGTPTGAAQSRIRDLQFRSMPVRDSDTFLLATNDYRAHGGGGFPGAEAANIAWEGDTLIRDTVVGFLRDAGQIAIAPPRTWRFHAMPGTSVLFETGADAFPTFESALAPEISATLSRVDETPGGFARLRLRL